MDTATLHAIELGSDGRFACDAPSFDPQAPTLDNWTADRCPDGLYQARYTGARNAITGEWTGGDWVDDAAPDLLAHAKASARSRVNLWRDQQEAGGFDWNGHRWDSDEPARQRIMAVALAGIEPPTGYWTDANNADVPMTLADMAVLYQTMIIIAGQIHDRQRQLKLSIEAATTVAEVEAITIGWPE
jgi:hypothetical protein